MVEPTVDSPSLSTGVARIWRFTAYEPEMVGTLPIKSPIATADKTIADRHNRHGTKVAAAMCPPAKATAPDRNESGTAARWCR